MRTAKKRLNPVSKPSVCADGTAGVACTSAGCCDQGGSPDSSNVTERYWGTGGPLLLCRPHPPQIFKESLMVRNILRVQTDAAKCRHFLQAGN